MAFRLRNIINKTYNGPRRSAGFGYSRLLATAEAERAVIGSAACFGSMLSFSPEEVMASYITRYQALIGSLCATALCLAPSIPYAAERYSAVCPGNETQAELSIGYRSGKESWQKIPGAKQWLSWKCFKPNEGRSLDFHVVLDFNSSASGYFDAKKLRGFAAEAETFDLGHQYVFRHGPSKRHIELWDISPPGVPASSWPPNAIRVD